MWTGTNYTNYVKGTVHKINYMSYNTCVHLIKREVSNGVLHLFLLVQVQNLSYQL